MSRIAKRAFQLLASYGLAIVLLFLLLVLTFFGTLEQVEIGLYAAQKKYFESWFLVHWILGAVPIVLPGAYLVMQLLFVNMLCGAVIRARKNWRRPGMLIAHSGILFCLMSGFVTYHFSHNGHMTLYEGERSSEFESYHEWEIALTETGGNPSNRQWVIPEETFRHLGGERERGFYAEGLPFELRLHGFAENSRPQRAASPEFGVDGVVLASMPRAEEAERNVAGVYATLVEKNGGRPHQGILWGLARGPWVVTVDGRDWAVDLRRKRWQVPFTIVLDKFTRELHPGTQIASNFESEVTKIENGVSRQIHIKMNEPLRHKGYTFFQSGWGPQNAGPNARLFSTFAVVKNPADQWPKYACYVISAGLLLHFAQSLFGYLKRERTGRA